MNEWMHECFFGMFNGIVLSLFELQQATHASDKFPQRPHCSRYGKEKGRKREGKGKEKGRGGQERKNGSGGQDSSTVDIRGELPATISAWQSCADSRTYSKVVLLCYPTWNKPCGSYVWCNSATHWLSPLLSAYSSSAEVKWSSKWNKSKAKWSKVQWSTKWCQSKVNYCKHQEGTWPPGSSLIFDVRLIVLIHWSLIS